MGRVAQLGVRDVGPIGRRATAAHLLGHHLYLINGFLSVSVYLHKRHMRYTATQQTRSPETTSAVLRSESHSSTFATSCGTVAPLEKSCPSRTAFPENLNFAMSSSSDARGSTSTTVSVLRLFFSAMLKNTAMKAKRKKKT